MTPNHTPEAESEIMKILEAVYDHEEGLVWGTSEILALIERENKSAWKAGNQVGFEQGQQLAPKDFKGTDRE